MKVYEVMVCRWHECARQRQYRNVGTVMAESLWEALEKAQEQYADAPDPNEDESICLGPESRPPTRFELIDADT
jgi:hypothetical protein